jgi:16S rRNA (guanine(966)-N(2))-methyltransferase RsmD
VRIIGGQWRRTWIPVASVPGLRPTPDRVRETLFNWLGQDLTGWRVLDLFAGTGVLGFEAASRSALSVAMVERDPHVLEALRATRERLNATQVAVEAGDALIVGRRLALKQPRGFDLILLDPPFGAGWPQRVRPLLGPLLADGGWVYLEAEAALATQAGEPEAWAGAGFTLARSGSAGRVHYHLLQFQSSSCHEDCGLSGNI